MLRTTWRTWLIFFTFFFLPMMYFIQASTRACLFEEGEGYHMRMRTGQLPTEMDAHKTPFPAPYKHHIENEPSSSGQTTKCHSTNKRHCTNVKMFI